MSSSTQRTPSNPRYPIGPFEYENKSSAPERDANIGDIEALPARLRDVVSGLTDAQFDTAYRDGGWTVRQLVHHVADSHLNAYVRWKLALAEDNPVIKPYDQDDWVKMPDVQQVPVMVSLALLDALHERLVSVMRNMSDEDFDRTYYHPEQKRSVALHEVLALYAWHGKHHTAHVAELRERNRW